MFNSKKVLKVIVLALALAMAFSSMTAFAAGNITWQVKDYITAAGASGTVGGGLGTGQGGPDLVPPYEIVYEQYLDGVATGLLVSGTAAECYGLKGFASSITRPVNWYDIAYPNLQYEEIWADGEYTGLIWPTGAQLPKSAYKDFRYMWEVGGTHKEVALTKANLGGTYFGDPALGYPSVYTGANADVKEENIYFGFDVFEVYEDGKARDVEVVLDTEGNSVNSTNLVKANYMINAANENTLYGGSITGLVNSGAGVDSVLYDMLANDGAPVSLRVQDEGLPTETQVPVYDYTGFPNCWFDNKLPITHYFQLTGPTYDEVGAIVSKDGLVIDAYEDVVSDAEVNEGIGDEANLSHDWDYTVDPVRYSYYTNNLITTLASDISAVEAPMAETEWVYAGWELAEPYRMYEYLSIEGIVFDGDIDNDSVLDTPVIFRYSGGLADPKVEWKYAWVETSYPHEIYAQKYVENMEGDMIAVEDFRGVGKYAKENYVANNAETGNVHTVGKHYQGRLEWMSNDGILYVSPWVDFDTHAAEFIELSESPNPSYLGAYDFQNPGAPVNADPTVKSINDID